MEKKPWLKSYDKGIPESLAPYPDLTLLDVLAETARKRPGHPALYFKGTRISYGELETLSNRFAAALVSLGVKKGDRVALMMPNCPQFPIVQLGAWKAGAITASINPLYTERELEHALKECGAETAVVMTLFYDKIKALQANTGVRRVVATSIKEFLPPALRILFTLLREKKDGHRIALKKGDHWLGDLLRVHAEAGRPEAKAGPDDPAIILFTGGTTGLSKAAVGTHRSMVMTGLQIAKWFDCVLEEWNDRFLMNLPLFHLFAVIVQSVALLSRGTMILVPNPRDLNDVLSLVKKTRPTFLPGVPTLFNALLAHPLVTSGKVDMTSVKLSISGAAPLMADTKTRFEEVTRGRIVEAFGLTESMTAACITPINGKYKQGSAGIPAPDVIVRIADESAFEKEMPLGEVGELLIRAPQMMRGYFGRPEETAETIRDGWLCTGDLGYMDEDGYVFIVDRKKDVIKPSGFQVWPREVEEVISTHPAVAEVGVAGVPDDRSGEAVKAWVVLAEGKSATAEEIRAYCKEKLAGYKVPSQVAFLAALPKTAVGKVLRRALRAM